MGKDIYSILQHELPASDDLLVSLCVFRRESWLCLLDSSTSCVSAYISACVCVFVSIVYCRVKERAKLPTACKRASERLAHVKSCVKRGDGGREGPHGTVFPVCVIDVAVAVCRSLDSLTYARWCIVCLCFPFLGRWLV